MFLVRRHERCLDGFHAGAWRRADSRPASGTRPVGRPARHCCGCEPLERRRLLAATPVAVANESRFGIEASWAIPGSEGVGPAETETYDLAVLASGKTLVTGGALVRLGADGIRDPSFGANGGVGTPRPGGGRWGWWNAVLPLAGDKVLVGGTLIDPADASRRTPLLARYAADGSPDATFGPGSGPDAGTVYPPFVSATSSDADGGSILELAPLPDGAYLAAGFVQYDGRPGDPQDLAMWKVRADGTPDPSFGGGGLRVLDLTDGAESSSSVVVRPAGGFFAATTGGVLAFDAGGSLAGRVGDAGPAVIAPGAGGTLLTARPTEGGGDVLVHRYLADGSPDPEFGGPAGVFVDFDGQAGAPTSVLAAANGRTLVATPNRGAYRSAFDVVSPSPDGAPDAAFGYNGRITEIGWTDAPARLAAVPGGRFLFGAVDSVIGLFARSFVLDPGITVDDGGPYPTAHEGVPVPVSAQ